MGVLYKYIICPPIFAFMPCLASADKESCCLSLSLDLFPQSKKRKRECSQPIKPGKKRKYSHSVKDQSPAPARTYSKAKGRRNPGRGQRWQQRDTHSRHKGAARQQQRGICNPADQPRGTQKTKRKQPQASNQHRAKRQAGFRPAQSQRQGKSGPRRKQAPKGKAGTFRKLGGSGKKRPA